MEVLDASAEVSPGCPAQATEGPCPEVQQEVAGCPQNQRPLSQPHSSLGKEPGRVSRCLESGRWGPGSRLEQSLPSCSFRSKEGGEERTSHRAVPRPSYSAGASGAGLEDRGLPRYLVHISLNMTLLCISCPAKLAFPATLCLRGFPPDGRP